MAIPDYEAIMLPLLQFAADGKDHKFGAACDYLAKHFGLTKEELAELLPSGRYPKFRSRASWARTYLTKAGLLGMPARGVLCITKRGTDALTGQVTVNTKYLRQFSEFQQFQAPKASAVPSVQGAGQASVVAAQATSEPDIPDSAQTPEERLGEAFLEMQNTLAQDLLDQVKQCTPKFFEYLVVNLLVAMGYGGSVKDAAQVVGKSGDGGIDGIIKEDSLGLSAIYVQAKRWNGPVGAPDIQKFIGALQVKHASKGVFITTSTFTEQASRTVRNIQCKVVLIDGPALAQLMIDYGVGVSVKYTYQVKRVDADFFTEE